MTLSSQKQNKKNQHRPVFFIFLWLVPIIAVNIGFFAIASIKNQTTKQQEQGNIQNELRNLASGANFEVQLLRHVNEFYAQAESSLRSYEEIFASDPKLKLSKSKEKLKGLNKRIFLSPFPDYEIYFFNIPIDKLNREISPKEAKDLLIFSNQEKISGVAQYCYSFQYMVYANKESRHNKKIKNKDKRKEMLTKLLNTEVIDASSIAYTQRNKQTICLYKKESSKFIWNYFEVYGSDQKLASIYGMFFFCRHTQNFEKASRAIALRNFANANKNKYAAFLPIFGKEFGGAQYSHPALINSKELSKWATAITTPNHKNMDSYVTDWQLRDFPTEIKIGNWSAYTYKGKDQSHLAVILAPNHNLRKLPYWLYCINFIGLSLCFMALIRGILFKRWPVVNIKTRFTISYILAAILPISLFAITLSGFLAYYKNAQLMQGIARLQSCINSFDARKSRVVDKYKSFFYEIIKDQQLLKSLQNKKGVMEETVKARLAQLCESKREELPIKSVAIIDEGGDTITVNYKNASEKGIVKQYTNQEINDPNIIESEDIDVAIQELIQPVSEKLHEFKKKAGIPNLKKKALISKEQRDFNESYKAMTNGKRRFTDDINGRKGQIQTVKTEGIDMYSRLHDFIEINELPCYALIMRWSDDALDNKTYKETLSKLAIENPNYSIAAFYSSIDGNLKPFAPDINLVPPESNQNAQKFRQTLLNTAKIANERNSPYNFKEDNSDLYYFAMPSKKYSKLTFAGAGSLEGCGKSITIALIISGIALFISFLAIGWSITVSADIVIKPILSLKKALDKIACGKLDISIESDNPDELGQLSRETSSMVQGLRERKMLATLISDSAMNAISSGSLDTESFNGVALVSDIRNFTGTCETQPPQLITELLNRHFSEMSKIIAQQGGKIYKFIGDAIEAVFPEDDKRGATASQRAFTAAAGMIAKLSEINDNRNKSNLFTYKIGIGLRYGTMFSGAIGSLSTRLDYAILGDPLKQAAKLEAMSIKRPEFPIVVDERIAHEVSKTGLKFEQTENNDNFPAYLLKDISRKNLSLTESAYSEQASSKKDSDTIDCKKFYTNPGIGEKNPWLFYSPSLFFIAFICCGIYFGVNAFISESNESYKTELQSTQSQIEEKFSVGNPQRLAVENNLRKLFASCETMLNNKESNEKITNEVLK